MTSWADKDAATIMADVHAMLTEFTSALPDSMWVPFNTYWKVFQRPVVRAFALRRRSRRPAFARAWR